MEYMRIHIHANIIVHIIVSTIVSDLWLEFLWLELILTSPKKTAVGAEKEMKLWVFYSSLKNFSLMSLLTALKRYSINPNYQIFRVIYIHQ